MKPHQDFKHEGTLTDSMVKMTIDENSTAYLMSILTDLYSDPIKAVVREYSTNARDSHVEAGVDLPIEVTCPTPLSPTLVIKDRGVGLSVEEVNDNFSKYGFSTKRDSDEVAGMLGLGCKSGLTLATQFTMVATKDGTAASVLVTRDADGAASLQVVEKWDTDQPNGVEVQIPIKPDDFRAVETAVQEFFYFWPIKSVLINGYEPTRSLFFDQPQHTWLDPDSVALVEHDGYNSYLRHDVIVMGGVPYPVENLFIGQQQRAVRRRPVTAPFEEPLARPFASHKRVVAFVPMGSVNFVPSREALHMTRRTEEVMADLRDWIRQYFKRGLQAKLDTAMSPQAAVEALMDWIEVSGLRDAPDFATYMGRPIPANLKWSRNDTVIRCLYGRAPARDCNVIMEWPILRKSHFSNIDVKVIVTGHTAKNVSPTNRDAVANFADTVLPEVPGDDNGSWDHVAIFCDDDIDPENWLGARKITLEELTAKWRVSRKRVSADSYRCIGDTWTDRDNASITMDALDAWLASGKRACWINVETRQTDQECGYPLPTFFEVEHDLRKQPKTKVVVVEANRLAKFKRKYPDIPTAAELLHEARDKFIASLSENERLALAFGRRSYYDQTGTALNPETAKDLLTIGPLVDADLVWAAGLNPKVDDKKREEEIAGQFGAISRAIQLTVTDDKERLLGTDPTYERLVGLLERYPLLAQYRYSAVRYTDEKDDGKVFYDYVQAIAVTRRDAPEALEPVPAYGPPDPTPEVCKKAQRAYRDWLRRQAVEAEKDRVAAEIAGVDLPVPPVPVQGLVEFDVPRRVGEVLSIT